MTPGEISGERLVLLGIWAAAAAACALGALDPPGMSHHPDYALQALELARVATAAALAIVLLLGPGLAIRTLTGRRIGLAIMPLPGLAVLIGVAGIAWLLASRVEPQIVCLVACAPLLCLLLAVLLSAGPSDLLDPAERQALLLVGFPLAIAAGRSLWSLGPVGELYAGGISRNLVSEGRPDSRIPFLMPQLIAHGTAPYSDLGSSLFSPFNFSSRGPLAGMASSPVVFLTGAKPPAGLPEVPWRPFDPQGFMAFRLAMITFSCTVFLSLWELVRRIAGTRAARLSLIVAVATPFVISDLWFTWPKLLAAAFVLLGGLYIVERSPLRSGLSIGVGFLMHPSGLIGASGAGLLALWPARGASWRRPDIRATLLFAVGVAVSLVGWRLLNGSHYSQDEFLNYILGPGLNHESHFGLWLEYRFASVANTLVPMFLPLVHGNDVSINGIGESSPFAIHFFFQYWTGLPFGFGILFFPLLLLSLWRAGRLWPWPVLATVLFPFLAFAIYWGASDSGLLREGLQSWVFVLIAFVAFQQAHAGLPWLRSIPIRAILALRSLEVLAVALGPVLASDGLRPPGYALTDVAALIAMIGGSLGLALAIWRMSNPTAGAAGQPRQ
jgi:hypothetical protein